MPEKPVHLVVSTPSYGGQVASSYATSLLKLQQACQRRGDIDLSVNVLSGDALITRARQNLVAHFLSVPSTTHLLFIDSDIVFEPDQVFRLLEFDSDMAAAAYPLKRMDWAKIEALVKEGSPRLEPSALSYVLEFENPQKIEKRGDFAKVRYAGTGFLLIRRKALQSMIERYSDRKYSRESNSEDPLKGNPWRCALFDCLIERETGTYLSEDYSFCRRWTDMGGEIWTDLQSRLTHMGTQAFNGDLSVHQDKAKP